ncbi:hypothetical protein [Saccharopolyspora spinosa]|uniref:Uncharacterized protein n=1 Tax=Saccharopolyspora spinosa TaxID=60894 RepID=A0A2N3XQ30_SACSN|nr:hypothetical protein [Saccharopolyspora spinosa]PKW12788.1 hypothetical protein A8926_0277 [Saccharopolyspora spinosa]
MQHHPSTGRRNDHADSGAGAITVAELMKRIPLSPEHERLADQLLKTPDPADAALPLRSRIVLGSLGALLLLGAASVGAKIIVEPAAEPHPASSAAPIDGASALRPDLVRNAGWPFTDNGGFAAAAGSGGTTDAPEPGEQTTANPAAGSQGSALSLVNEFYRRLQHDPSSAARLVAPGLLAGQRAELVRGWEAVESLQLRARTRSVGVVLAEVEARYPDGHRVVLRQLLTVESGAHPKIVEAELLGARHVSPW